MNSNEKMIREHLQHLRRINARQVTIGHRRDNLQRLAAALPCELRDADADLLQRWQDDMHGRLSVSTIRTYTAHTRGFYKWAEQHGRIDVDPARELRSPKLRAPRARPIGEDPLRVALACCTSDVLQVWLVLAAFCGLRAGEIARLTREDVGEETLDVDGKGGHPRTVPLPKAVRDLLVPHLVSAGPLWRRDDNRAVSPRYVSDKACTHLREVGTDATLHALRHRYATRMYQLSKDPKMIQELLGHASLDTTTRYLAVSAERGRETAHQLAETLQLRRPPRTSPRGDERSGWAA